MAGMAEVMTDAPGLDNPNPEVKVLHREPRPSSSGGKQPLPDLLFDAIRDIRDPEHPHSLEELSVVDASSISITPPPDDSPSYGKVVVTFTPTVPHCSLASIIGLCIHHKLRHSGLLDPPGDSYYKLTVQCADGSHASGDDINRQLADKERVSAAFENPKILSLLMQCIDNLPG